MPTAGTLRRDQQARTQMATPGAAGGVGEPTGGGPLEAFFSPRRVVIIGAEPAPGSSRRLLLENLEAFNGEVIAVGHPALAADRGQAVASLAELQGHIDLAIVLGPAAEVPERIRECVRRGVSAAMVLSGGFRETGGAGARLAAEVQAAVRGTGMRLIGPNTLGLMVPQRGFNASTLGKLARPGSVAFLSESGALCASILDRSQGENVGFSGVVTTGAMADVGWGDLIYHFGDDPLTRSIVIYMETVGDARHLLSAIREVALAKPVIVLKAGRSTAAASATVSNAGALASNDAILDAAFRRVGVLRVETIAELFDLAEVLAKQPRPPGPRLAIVTNSGGSGALATDALTMGRGSFAGLGDEAIARLETVLPGHWSRANPIDILENATPETYARAMEAVVADPANDGVLVIHAPQPGADALGAAASLRALGRPTGKPILTSWMGGASVQAARELLNASGFPTFDHPDAAARTFCRMWEYSDALRGLYETPAQVGEPPTDPAARTRIADLIARVRATDRTQLTEVESKELLGASGVPVAATWVALSENEAVRLANKVGYPVVLKLHSETLTHKTEVGGVQLNLRNPIAVREAWRTIETRVAESAHRSDFLGVTVQPMVIHNGCELLLGSTLDLEFGPTLIFGAGGHLAEVFNDRAFALPPLNATLARRAMEQTRVYRALRGVRGRKAVNLAALEALLVRFSYLVVEQPDIAEIDINPLIVACDSLVAVDARIVLHAPDLDLSTLPRAAIRPYPNQYVTARKLTDGTPVTIRPILPEDEPRLVAFHRTLSDRSVYHRYFYPLKLSERIAHERLVRVCFSDYDRAIPLVAEFRTEAKAPSEIIGIGRLTRERGSSAGEFALIVSDAWQRRGLGQQLLELVIHVARQERLTRLTGHILAENREMLGLCSKLGFQRDHPPENAECIATLAL